MLRLVAWEGLSLGQAAVVLGTIDPDFLRELLSDAWEEKASRRLW